MKYTIKGSYTKNNENHSFTKTVDAKNTKLAQEHIYTMFGSKNKLKRRQIKINEVKESD